MRRAPISAGRVNSGSQSQVALGAAPGGWAAGVHPASRDLANTSELVRGLLLRQDAVAWHKPTNMGGPGLSTKNANLTDIDLGRPLSQDEVSAVTQAMAKASGNDFFSPIGTPNGFRFLNVPDASGLSNAQFQRLVRGVVQSDILPGEAQITHAHADNGYFANDWRENPNGEDYLRALGGTGRPDLQRAAAQLLATLGPRVGQVEDDFANRLGWTPDRGSRVWENPVIERYGGGVVPSPPRPWLARPAPQGGPSLFDTGPPGPRLIPVDHDPFAEAAQ
jgi:hypothetical protein